GANDPLRMVDLGPAGEQMVGVEVCPAIVLGVGELEKIGFQRDRHLDDFADVVDVQTRQHYIQNHGITVSLDQPCDLQLEIEGARARQEIVDLLRRVLK